MPICDVLHYNSSVQAIDSSHTHLALAAQHESKVSSLHRAALRCNSMYGTAHSIA